MKKEELLKLCTYYKGEKVNPYKLADTKGMYWELEYNYINNVFDRKAAYWEGEGIEMAKGFNDAKAVLDRYTEKAVKGMIAYMFIMNIYNDAGGGTDFILDYGK